MIANAPLSTFSTIIVSKHMGFSGVNALLLTIPVGAFGGCFMVLVSFCAMKFRNIRTYLYFGAQMLTVFAALLLWNLPTSAVGGLLFALYIMPGVGGGYAVLMGLHLANTAGYTKRSLASSGIFIGYCVGRFLCTEASHFLAPPWKLFQLGIRSLTWVDAGNIVGPQVFRSQDSPGYVLGFVVVVISSVVAAVLGLVYRFVCIWENKRRDAAGVMEGFDDAFNDDFTDKKVCCSRSPRFPFVRERGHCRVFGMCKGAQLGTSLTCAMQNPQFRYIL